jgi:uncharacterized metal-binding protein YceD (DUF177 family)
MRNDTKSHEVSWTVPVVVADIEEGGLRVAIEADEAERDAIARAIGLRDLSKLSADFELTPLGHEEVQVIGQVNAVVGQTCVVTLDRVDNTVSEPVSLVFAPPAMIAEVHDQDEGDEPPTEDPPEPIVNGRIDLAKLAVEFLILGIDPYPRKPGAVFEPVHTPPAAEDHPFAGLAALKEPKPVSTGQKPPRKRS